MFEPLKGQRRLTLISSEKGVISADENMIERVCQNLIDNAIKFTDATHGEITVDIKIVGDDKVHVSVTDNGHGIPLEYHEKVFDKFFQVAARKQKKVHSSGLGITFCKLAVEASGGHIGLESEVDRGSTFWFELPCQPNKV
jgi:signal transduction histidine kinase